MPITGIPLGFLVGSIPTISMILSSATLSRVHASGKVEAAFQNFAAGLILAAVAAELFPLMLNAPKTASYVGVTIGFAVGLVILNGLEYLIEKIEGWSQDEVSIDGSHHSSKSGNSQTRFVKTLPEGLQLDMYDTYDEESGIVMSTSIAIPKPSRDDLSKGNHHGRVYMAANTKIRYMDWEEEPINQASKAFEIPDHRNHILEHMREVARTIEDMENQSNRLLEDNSISQREAEDVAEKIDEEIHSLQYKLDHCRRLIQGSETEYANTSIQTWVTEDRKVAMKQRLRNLKLIVDHVIEHLNETQVDGSLLRELYVHMDQMEQQINIFHNSVATVSQRWSRRNRPLFTPKQGDTLPVGLVIPVSLDCFVDGFLIGVTCVLSSNAGFILGAANCLEMGFLGMAYSTRISKCTGSSAFARTITLYGPPFVMFLASGFGAFLGIQALSVPTVFVGFVSFGVVVLLSLVCNELLIEAKEAQGEDEKWYIAITIFAGIYVVLMFSRAGI